jgi:DNA-binding response OmpR family regulator
VNVLIVEDDEAAARLLRQAVTEAGYSAQVVRDGRDVVQLATSEPFDLILLDIMLPGLDGLAVCRALRAATVAAPILMLTARDTTEDKVAGLDSGADDYLVKPFRIAELLARMRALLRRNPVSESGGAVLRVADLSLNTATREATRAGKTFALSATEYKLLEHLMRYSGQVLTRSALLDHVWQYDFGGHDNVLDVYIRYLRNKIDRSHEHGLIQTVRGVGYRIVAPNDVDRPQS